MEALPGKVRQYAERYDLFRPGELVVVAVSGGPDSLCLLHLLHGLAPALGLQLHVAHLNHGLRGEDADADARFVAGFAAALGLPCTIGQADVRALADAPGISLEEAARQARYRFLSETARAVGARTIAVGHNADDQAETVLMHFLRGSGLAGLRGMAPKTALGEYWLGGIASRQTPPLAMTSGGADFWLIRPLLAIPRRAIEAYCAEHGLAPRFDRSNADTTFFRNRLRHELLPILEQYNPAIRAILAHTAEALAGDHQIVRAEVEAAWGRVWLPQAAPLVESPPFAAPPEPVEGPPDLPFDKLRGRGAASAASTFPEPVEGPLLDLPFDKLRGRGAASAASTFPELVEGPLLDLPFDKLRGRGGRVDHGELHLDLRAWRELPLGLQRAVLREAIHTLRASLRNINWAHVERAAWLCRAGTTGQKATLAAGLEVEIGYDTLRIGPEGFVTQPGGLRSGRMGVPQLAAALALAAPGSTDIGGGRIEIRRVARAALPADLAGGGDPRTAFLDADAVGPELWVRSRRPGDRFQPQGMGGHSMKLNEFMINLKVPKDARAGWPLLTGRGGIAWACGLRVAEWAAVRETTQGVWVVSLA